MQHSLLYVFLFAHKQANCDPALTPDLPYEKSGVSLLAFGFVTLLLKYLFSRKKTKNYNKNKIKSDFKKKLVDLANKEWDKWNKSGKVTKARHKKILKMAKGYRGRAKTCFTVAIEKVEKFRI